MTKKEMYNAIIEKCAEYPEIVTFCSHEIELLEKKNSRKSGPTKAQRENAVIKELIKEVLTEEPKSIKEIQEAKAELKEFSSQKMAALLNQLVKAEEAAKVKDGKTVKFKRAE